MYGGIVVSFQTFVPPHRHTIAAATSNPIAAAPAPRRPLVRILTPKLNRFRADKGCRQELTQVPHVASRTSSRSVLVSERRSQCKLGRCERSTTSWLGMAQGAYSISSAHAGKSPEQKSPEEWRSPTKWAR